VGAVPVEVPVLDIRPPESFSPLDAALQQIESYDWLILTSSNAVRALLERANVIGISPERIKKNNLAVVGEGTAAVARKSGLKVTLVPESYVAESLVAVLSGRTQGKRILLARATVARDVIPDALRASGAFVDVVDAYRNLMPKAAPEQLRRALASGIDAVTFTSSSSVTHLRQAAETAGLRWPLAEVKAASIGPITGETLRESGWQPDAEASTHDVSGLVSALVRLLA
jgi:uroporphyrinogen-III synthase